MRTQNVRPASFGPAGARRGEARNSVSEAVRPNGEVV